MFYAIEGTHSVGTKNKSRSFNWSEKKGARFHSVVNRGRRHENDYERQTRRQSELRGAVNSIRHQQESLTGREASTATSHAHPTNQRSWFHASHESAHTAGISCRGSLASSVTAFPREVTQPTSGAAQIVKRAVIGRCGNKYCIAMHLQVAVHEGRGR